VEHDGSLSIRGQDENNLKRITITPSAETVVAALSVRPVDREVSEERRSTLSGAATERLSGGFWDR
jgi:hypothetical protein